MRREHYIMSLPRSVVEYFPAQQLLKAIISGEEGRDSSFKNVSRDEAVKDKTIYREADGPVVRLSPVPKTNNPYDEALRKYRLKLARQKRQLLKNMENAEKRFVGGLLRERRNSSLQFHKLENQQDALQQYFSSQKDMKLEDLSPKGLKIVPIKPVDSPQQLPTVTQLRRAVYSNSPKKKQSSSLGRLPLIREQFEIEPWRDHY